jgi:hypothetical protein
VERIEGEALPTSMMACHRGSQKQPLPPSDADEDDEDIESEKENMTGATSGSATGLLVS